jgi:hypothetical protein
MQALSPDDKWDIEAKVRVNEDMIRLWRRPKTCAESKACIRVAIYCETIDCSLFFWLFRSWQVTLAVIDQALSEWLKENK